MNSLTLRELLQFVPIKGYEEYYKVSKDGRIYSIKKGKFLKPVFNRGREIVTLCKNGDKKNKKIHRIVAEHFLHDGREGSYSVFHHDKDYTNNHMNNLYIRYQ